MSNTKYRSMFHTIPVNGYHSTTVFFITQVLLLLQYLEKTCAAKTISERHTTTASFYIGGDDIEDYDRSIQDLHINYDWHDDGFLPKPAAYKTTCATDTSNGDDGASTSILHECCYKPHKSSVQPSSRYEKNASTKDWVRGDRLVSLSLEDYEYAVDSSSHPNEKHNETVLSCDQEDTTESLFFDLSPAVLANEEESLLDIMIPMEQQAPTESAACKKKRRKRKTKQSKIQIEQQALSNNQTNDTSLDWKEGYLLFGCDRQDFPLTKRVFVKVRKS